MKIREYQEGDETQISSLISSALRGHQYDFKGTNQKLIDHDVKIYNSFYIRELAHRALLYLAVSDDGSEIYGVASLDGDELHTCYTRGDFQKKGVGKSLITHIEKIAKSHGIKLLKVYGNFYAEPFYESCGFKLMRHTEVDFVGALWPVVYMEKVLGD